MSGHSENRRLSDLELAAVGGPFRLFRAILQDGRQVIVSFQTYEEQGFEFVPACPKDAHIHEAISHFSSITHFG